MLEIVFDRLMFVIADELRIGPDEAAVKDSTRQAAIIVSFDRLQVPDRNPRLFRDVTQSNPRASRASRSFSPMVSLTFRSTRTRRIKCGRDSL